MSLVLRRWISRREPLLRCLQTASAQKNENNEETHFGFERVKASEKPGKVHEVFEKVADSYDLMNDVMSLGIHRIWKDIFMHRLAPIANTRLLDVAGGTGDVAFRFLEYTKNHKGCHVTICDINSHMLAVGRKRAEAKNLSPEKIEWRQGDAEALPFENDSFDAYTVAFGIRNCTHLDRVLSEAYRVLKPGGRFLCLEFSQVTNSTFQSVYNQYSFQLIPVFGQILVGDWKPYQYLVESIRQFPNQVLYRGFCSLLVSKENFRKPSSK